ncbi:hypothetical protein [Staphylococcus simiae]|uniref:Uncharacterized protein n=1 Tax=Staphylococcus simiae CCM 7213 = CCUG 51256 TaxID=911238 RepID=G5JHA0_9STAP|nr:hypothetical protein [Staphylococcus simiae]EHJ08448.1 hypothetical protein SS7213T_04145 [Staphylococcus simiae CCM 7213 = CCUG 51256]SNV67494.1 Uncharacterised protein [Staphylococcus simiae]
MDFKIVYLYNGEQWLAFKKDDGEYDYPDDEWTEVEPPAGIYTPMYFNGSEWIGATKEEWEQSLPKPEPIVPTDNEKIIANLQMQLMKSNMERTQMQKQLAMSLLDGQKKEKAIQVLQEQQGQIVLELTKLKGGN